MKKIFYTLSLLTIILISSCTKELLEEESTLDAGTIQLTLRSIEPQTKATQPGETAYNENLIKSVHYFFYPKDGTDSNTEKEPAKRGQVLNLNKQNQHTITVNASEDEIKNILFKYPYNDCDVYVIVNLPSDINIDELPDRKLSTLKNIVLETNFEANLIQPSFVMEGLNVATVVDRNKVLAAKGTIPVDRVASKITVSIEVEDRIDLQTPPDTPDNLTSGMIWTSEPEQMKIEFVNGVNRTVLSGNPNHLTLTPEDRYNVIHTVPTIDEDEPKPESWTCDPFYTYPTKWEMGSDEEPYLFITLPWTTVIWTPVEGQQPPIYKTYPCYYKIMLSSDELKRNTWYDLKINIGILGSFENTPEVILPIEDIDYFVADWYEGKNITSEILGGRYLVVDKETYTIYNENTLTIPFTSSHECEIVNAVCKHPNLANNTTPTVSNYSLSITDANSSITYEKVLDNNLYSPTFDFTPYTTTFTIRHKDKTNYYKQITIIQYPAIYGIAERNTDYSNGGGTNGDNGYVWVNGYQGKPVSGVTNFGGAYGANSDDLTAVSMYVFTITSLEGTDYIIGDPRTNTIDNLGSWNNNTITWATAPAVFDNQSNRKLKYYYPTNADITLGPEDPTWNMIAPKLRVCSAYGAIANDQTNRRYYENVEGRCASYQEDGYPAGRWRLPTKAEFEFINTLSNRGLIPTLYVTTMDYWCAHGYGRYNNGSVSLTHNDKDYGNASVSVRCVYDEWYWENSQTYRLGTKNADGTFTPSDTFTWGDMPRDQFDAKTE